MIQKLEWMVQYFCALSVFKALLFLVIFGGCTNNPPIHPNSQKELDFALINDEIAQLNEQILARAKVHTDPSDYLLGAGDLLQVGVFEAKELNTKARVSSRGYITLPLIGQVLVKGLSAREAEQKIEDLYQKRYIKDPHVSIFVEEHYSQRVTLVGQFKNPGTYDYLSKHRLLDVMALGGGLSEKAGQIVQVRRIGSTPGEPGTFIVDIDQLIKEGRDEFNIEINGGDVLFVPEAGVFFVDGAVRNPGAYPIKHRTIIQEALLEAGGFASYAKKDIITLVRSMESGERKVIVLDLTKQDVRELEIKDRDIIVVDASAYGKLVHGLGIHIGIPGAGIGYKDPEIRY
jgi:polysaccharide export outer membrane protein